jgi:hypothetical protein
MTCRLGRMDLLELPLGASSDRGFHLGVDGAQPPRGSFAESLARPVHALYREPRTVDRSDCNCLCLAA